jgi:hypothetical protein
MNIIDPILWIKKYFIEFSRGEISIDIKIGKKLSIFISSETHNINLVPLLMANKILNNKNNLNIIRGHKIIILIRI